MFLYFRFHMPSGNLTWRNGDLYFGNWNDDVGNGTITYSDGTSYIGITKYI